jgi:hypothetical protein
MDQAVRMEAECWSFGDECDYDDREGGGSLSAVAVGAVMEQACEKGEGR